MSSRQTQKETKEIEDVLNAISQLNGKMDILLSSRNPSRAINEGCALNAMINHLVEDVDIDLDRCMVGQCDCRTTCKEVFTDFLQRSAKLVGEERVEEKNSLR